MCGSFLAGNELGAMEETCRALYRLYFGGKGGRRGQFRLAPRQQDFHPLVVRATANASCACVGDGCACGGGRAGGPREDETVHQVTCFQAVVQRAIGCYHGPDGFFWSSMSFLVWILTLFCGTRKRAYPYTGAARRVVEHRTRLVCLGETPSPRVRCRLAMFTFLLTYTVRTDERQLAIFATSLPALRSAYIRDRSPGFVVVNASYARFLRLQGGPGGWFGSRPGAWTMDHRTGHAQQMVPRSGGFRLAGRPGPPPARTIMHKIEIT